VANGKQVQKTIDDDSHVHAAALVEKRASVKFLLHGPGKQAQLDNLVVGMNSSKKSNGAKQTCI
jgi:hypothetical protein